MNDKRKNEFARTFDVDGDIVAYTYGITRDALYEEFSMIDLKVMVEAVMFDVFSEIAKQIHPEVILLESHFVLGMSVTGQAKNYFDELPESVRSGRYRKEVFEAVSEYLESEYET